MSKKYFVLDTNVILHDPHCLHAFEEHPVVVPLKVFEELDKFKTYNDIRGVNARMFIRKIEPMLDDAKFTDISNNNGNVYITEFANSVTGHTCYIISANYFDSGMSNDNIILSDILRFKKHFVTGSNMDSADIVLVSKDINLRIKAKQFGIIAEDYENTKLTKTPNMNGNFLYASDNFVNRLHENKIIPCQYKDVTTFLNQYNIRWQDNSNIPEVKYNDYFLIKSELAPERSVLVKYQNDNFVKVTGISSVDDQNIMGINAKNYKQSFLIDALLDQDMHIVFAIGQAGSGKTLLSIAAGLYHVTECENFDKIIIARPVVTMGKELGAVPGGVDEKINPYMQPLYDNLGYIYRNATNSTECSNYLYNKGLIDVLALPYIRGRSLHNSFVIIDEAQNMTVGEMKTVLTRIGDNSKIVFTGDISQIDNPYLDERDNGLSVVSKKFRDYNSKLATTVCLDKCARGVVASETIECL